MEVHKAQRLLHKIQALLENNPSHELSRLEKDLLKSYILQLYDTVQDEQATPIEQPVKMQEVPVKQKTEFVPPPVKVTEPVVEVPPVIVPEIKTQKPVEVPMEIKYPEPEITFSAPKVENKTVHVPVQEPVREVHKTFAPQIEKENKGNDEALVKLFEQQKNDDVSERFSQVPISSIESAMGLNERIFTLNELFGGDKALFDATCSKLNQFHSFAEARQLLMNGPARDFRWGDTERLKMAEHFLRIVSRRYPKS
jgi:hypothetical protein